MKLPLSAKISLLNNLSNDYLDFIRTGNVPKMVQYKVLESEDRSIRQSAREAALETIKSDFIEKLASDIQPKKLVKNAFDTRRVDQLNDRVPRKNLQYWHRSDQFINEEDSSKLKTFAKLASVLDKIKKELGTQPEWFESYARQLYDNVHRILRVKESDLDIFRPQLSYLEQLVFARYRLSIENLEKYSDEQIEKKILSKDEDLIGRSEYLRSTSSPTNDEVQIKNSDGQNFQMTKDSFINAIFGSGSLRRDGEKTVERTITITLRDNVID